MGLSRMNKRHKAVLALSLAVAGLALLNGAKVSEGFGIILVGASLAWLIGAQFVLAGSMFLWRHRVWSAITVAVAVGAVFGWIRYDNVQTEKREETRRAKMQPIWDCEARNSQFSNADTECERDPGVTLQPLQVPQAQPAYSDSPHSPPRPRSRHVKALYDADLTTTEIGFLKCGQIRKGDAATLLVDDGTWVKIKTADGQVGWAFSNNFEVVGK